MKKLIALLLALAMVLALAACGGSETPAPDQGGNTPAVGGNDTPDNSDANVDPEADKYGGVATITIGSGTFNSVGNPVTGSTQQKIMSDPAIETLARYNAEGQAEPWLAKEIVTDPDNLKMVITLNEGIKYHDGTAFNAQAVCDVWKFYQDNNLITKMFANVASYEATGEYEVTVDLSTWNAYTVINLCIEAGRMISPTEAARVGIEGIGTSIVGTGPFKCESYDVATGIVYVRNEEYWGGRPYLDGINIVIHDEATVAENMLKTGEANVSMFLPNDMQLRLETEGFELINKPSCISPTCNGVFFASGNQEDPISDLRVRQAFCHALDKEALAEAFTAGLGVPMTQIAIEGSKEYNPDVAGYEYNPEKSKQLLKEAGYEEGECVITFYYQPAGEEDLFLAIAGMLEEAGFKVEGDTRTGSENRIIYGTSDPYTCCTIFYAPTTIDNWYRYFSATPFTYAVNTIDTKAAGIQDAYEGAMAAKTPEEMSKYMMELQKLVTEQAMYCPMYSSPALTAVTNRTLMDSGLADIWICQWTPETAWLAK